MDHFPVRYVTNNQSFECVPECPKNIKPTPVPQSCETAFSHGVHQDRFWPKVRGSPGRCMVQSSIIAQLTGFDDYWISTDHALKINSTFWRSSRSRVWWCLMQLQTKLSTPFFAPAQRCAVMSAYFGPRWTEDHGPMRTMDRWTMDQTPFKHCSLLPPSNASRLAQERRHSKSLRPSGHAHSSGLEASFEFVP